MAGGPPGSEPIDDSLAVGERHVNTLGIDHSGGQRGGLHLRIGHPDALIASFLPQGGLVWIGHVLKSRGLRGTIGASYACEFIFVSRGGRLKGRETSQIVREFMLLAVW